MLFLLSSLVLQTLMEWDHPIHQSLFQTRLFLVGFGVSDDLRFERIIEVSDTSVDPSISCGTNSPYTQEVRTIQIALMCIPEGGNLL